MTEFQHSSSLICFIDKYIAGTKSNVIACAEFQDENFRGYYFTGAEFPIFVLIFPRTLQQYNATALPAIVCYITTMAALLAVAFIVL